MYVYIYIYVEREIHMYTYIYIYILCSAGRTPEVFRTGDLVQLGQAGELTLYYIMLYCIISYCITLHIIICLC